MKNLYEALIEKSLIDHPKDGSTASKAIPAPYDKCLYEILHPDRPWPPVEEY